MSGFTFITLKLYHDGALLSEGDKARYVGGLVSEYYDIDVDTYHILRLKTTLKN